MNEITEQNISYWLASVEYEIEKAMAKFPTWPNDPQHTCAVVQEEAGELAKAVLQLMYEPEKSSIADIREEAVQTAAMCIRFLLSSAHYDWRTGQQHTQGT